MFNNGGRMKDIYCGNPTCQYCGATYGIAELHNCAAKQEALRKQKEQSIAHLEKELSKAQMTLRDQFAMHILPAIMLRYQEPGYTESGAVAEAYSIADSMMECRVI